MRKRRARSLNSVLLLILDDGRRRGYAPSISLPRHIRGAKTDAASSSNAAAHIKTTAASEIAGSDSSAAGCIDDDRARAAPAQPADEVHDPAASPRFRAITSNTDA